MKELRVYIQPNAHKSEIVGFHNGELKLKICSPPVDGKANKEVIKFLSKLFGIAKSKVLLLKGEKSRHKVIGLPEEIDLNSLLLRTVEKALDKT